MSERLPDCDTCGAPLRRKALVDSDERAWLRWMYCKACGWDERAEVEAIERFDENDVNDTCARGEHVMGVTR